MISPLHIHILQIWKDMIQFLYYDISQMWCLVSSNSDVWYIFFIHILQIAAGKMCRDVE